MTRSPASRETSSLTAGRERRARTWLGLLLVVVGAFLMGDTARRLQLAWEFTGRWWPWALLGLAVLNLLRSKLRIESVLAPGLLALVAAVVLAVRQGLAATTVLDFALPLVLAFAGASLLLSIGSRAGKSWTRVLTTGHVMCPETVLTILRPRAVLGEVTVDFRSFRDSQNKLTLHPTAVFGHVHLKIPAAWQLEVHAEGSLLTPLRDPADNGDSTGEEVDLYVLGFCGLVTISRV